MKIELSTQAAELLKAVAFSRSITPSDVILDCLSKGQPLFEARAVDDGDFERFWRAYPVKAGKEDARRAWRKTSRSRPKIEYVIAAVAKCSRSKAWNKRDENGHRYIPHAATWLNRGGWHDELEAAPQPAGKASADPVLEQRRKLSEIAGRYSRQEITEQEYDAAVKAVTGEG